MEPEFLSHILGNIGIPAALCFYTLFEVNKNLKRLSASIDRLSGDVDKRLDKVEVKIHELSFRLETLTKGADYHERH